MIYSNWLKYLDGDLENKYDIYIDSKTYYENTKDKIYIMCEPTLYDLSRLSFLNKYHQNFKLILTYDSVLLNKYKNAKLLLFGTTWIPKEYWGMFNNKANKISFWVGHKNMLEGHQLRHLIFNNYEKINNTDLFISKHHFSNLLTKNHKMILGDSKIPLFDKYKFHLCIENCKMENYFTEKIIDCFLTKTVPIYFGCTNINKYFNVNGIICINNMTLDEIIDLINNIDFNFYNQNINAINENYVKAQQYTDYNFEIIKNIKKLY